MPASIAAVDWSRSRRRPPSAAAPPRPHGARRASTAANTRRPPSRRVAERDAAEDPHRPRPSPGRGRRSARGLAPRAARTRAASPKPRELPWILARSAAKPGSSSGERRRQSCADLLDEPSLPRGAAAGTRCAARERYPIHPAPPRGRAGGRERPPLVLLLDGAPIELGPPQDPPVIHGDQVVFDQGAG